MSRLILPLERESFLPVEKIDGAQFFRKRPLFQSIVFWNWGIYASLINIKRELRKKKRKHIVRRRHNNPEDRQEMSVFWVHERRLHFINLSHCRLHPTPQFPETPLLPIIGINSPDLFVRKNWKVYRRCEAIPKPDWYSSRRQWPRPHTTFFQIPHRGKIICEFSELRSWIGRVVDLAENGPVQGELWTEDAWKAYNFWTKTVANLTVHDVGRIVASDVNNDSESKGMADWNFPLPEPTMHKTWHLKEDYGAPKELHRDSASPA